MQFCGSTCSTNQKQKVLSAITVPQNLAIGLPTWFFRTKHWTQNCESLLQQSLKWMWYFQILRLRFEHSGKSTTLLIFTKSTAVVPSISKINQMVKSNWFFITIMMPTLFLQCRHIPLEYLYHTDTSLSAGADFLGLPFVLRLVFFANSWPQRLRVDFQCEFSPKMRTRKNVILFETPLYCSWALRQYRKM